MTGNLVEMNAEAMGHVLKSAEEFTVGVDDDHTAQADFKEELSHEEIGEGFGGGCGSVFTDDEAGEGDIIRLAAFFVAATFGFCGAFFFAAAFFTLAFLVATFFLTADFFIVGIASPLVFK